MSDHEFEKQVRQKLDDLRLTPSAEAWENIEQGLHRGKRRREPLLWLPVLLILLGAGGYWWMKESDPRKEPSSAIVKSESGNVNLKSESGNTESANVNREPSNENRETGTVKRESPIVKDELAVSKREPIVNRKSPRRNRESGILDREISSVNRQPEIAGRESSTENRKPSIGITSLPYTTRFPSPDFSQLAVVLNFPSGPQPKLTELGPLHATLKISPPKKWSFGVNVFAGVSTMNEGSIFNFGEAKVADVAVSSRANTFSPSYTPSTISPGLAFSAGLVVKRELSKRFALSGGINYLQLNTKHKVGRQLYGTQAVNVGTNGYQFVNNAFALAQGRTEDYKNIYHFLEVPVVLNTRLNKSMKYPVYWNTGLAYSRLLASNNLLFDGSTGVYYKNDKLLNKSHASVTTGFDFVFFQQSKRPLWVGPSARYNISKLLNEDVPENKNFLSVGLDVKLFIK